MGKFMANGYDVISNTSRCFADYEEEILQMELELRKLEAANDSLQDENDRLNAELQKAAEFKADEGIAEIKRSIIDELEKMPAEEMKEFIVRTVSSVLTGSTDKPRKCNPNYDNLLKNFRIIMFPNADEASNFANDIKDLIDEYGIATIYDMWFILSERYPKAELDDGTKPGSFKVDYSSNLYGIRDKNYITHDTGRKVVRIYRLSHI